jgi:hypothetical protein
MFLVELFSQVVTAVDAIAAAIRTLAGWRNG